MNATKIYIEKVYSVEPADKGYVTVDMETNDWGCYERDTHLFSLDAWKKIEAQGYYMG